MYCGAVVLLVLGWCYCCGVAGVKCILVRWCCWCYDGESDQGVGEVLCCSVHMPPRHGSRLGGGGKGLDAEPKLGCQYRKQEEVVLSSEATESLQGSHRER